MSDAAGGCAAVANCRKTTFLEVPVGGVLVSARPPVRGLRCLKSHGPWPSGDAKEDVLKAIIMPSRAAGGVADRVADVENLRLVKTHAKDVASLRRRRAWSVKAACP
jgi:hypothetical protein